MRAKHLKVASKESNLQATEFIEHPILGKIFLSPQSLGRQVREDGA